MDSAQVKRIIENGEAVLGLELGSTRIKAVLIGTDNAPLASGSHSWENRLEDGIWTYHLDDVWDGIQKSYAALCEIVASEYGAEIKALKAMGFSAMMHGYLVFDKNGGQLAQFRIWRNTMTARAAEELTALFNFNIPQRWSIAHLYQAILNNEEHVKEIAQLTTLAGYVHYKLTGVNAVGVGEASGIFPIDSEKCDYDEEMTEKFDGCIKERNLPWKLRGILPKVLSAGENACKLTEAGAKLLDPSGKLSAGVPLCPPEGDAGTGMTATNSVAECTGNVSAGTSVFAMVVLKDKLKQPHTEIDMVTTPTGKPVAMVHCNNCTSEINAWAQLLCEFAATQGIKCGMPQALDAIFAAAAAGDADCGGTVCCNYFSGEPITKLDNGRPLLVRTPDAKFSFANFSRAQLYSAVATLKIGMDILLKEENISVKLLNGHGGFFKAENIGQQVLAAALDAPVSVMKTAGEGGPWGMALLAGYMVNRQDGETLEAYLERAVFASAEAVRIEPDADEVKGFADYMKLYGGALETERTAVGSI